MTICYWPPFSITLMMAGISEICCVTSAEGVLQDKARTSGTVCRTDDVFRADSLADVRGELGIVTNFRSHNSDSPSQCF